MEPNRVYKLYRCPECNQEFSEMDLLADHCQQIHEIDLVLENQKVTHRLATETEYTFVRAREYQAETTAQLAEGKALRRLEERLGRELRSDKIIVLDDNASPAAICNQVVAALTEIDQKKIVSGSIESTIRGNNIYFSANLVLPFSEQNMNTITAFANNIQQPKASVPFVNE